MKSWTTAEIKAKISSIPVWYHQIEVAPGLITPGVHASAIALQRLELPDDCRGLRVLDIGARDGFFSFEMERRGADVLAMDHVPPDQTGFAVAAELVGSRVPYKTANVYDLDDSWGQFDIVLFLGVLYHLRNPLLALDKIRAVCSGRMWLESHVMTDSKSVPLARFYPRDELNKDFSNWWGPNLACLKAMVESCNFAVESHSTHADRSILRCRIAEDRQLEYFRKIERSIVS